jgi:hypothetical protein
MSKDLEQMSSSELKEVLADVGKGISQEDELRDPAILQMERAKERQEEYQSWSPEEKLAYHNLPVPEEGEAQQRMARATTAFANDMRYARRQCGDAVANEVEEGIQSKRLSLPEESVKSSNPIYDLHLRVAAEQVQRGEMSAEAFGKMLPHQDDFGNIEDPEKLNPPSSQFVDEIFPQRVRPTPKPKARAEKTYKVPDLSTEDLQEALGDWMKKHPEKFR